MRMPMRVVLLLCLAVSVVAAQSKQYKDCTNNAKSQTELTQCAGEDARQADNELNRVYALLLAKAKDDAVAVAKIKAAQKAWVAFRDAHLQAIFPREAKQAEYGTMYPMCFAETAAELTRHRTAQLQRMLDTWADGGSACDY